MYAPMFQNLDAPLSGSGPLESTTACPVLGHVYLSPCFCCCSPDAWNHSSPMADSFAAKLGLAPPLAFVRHYAKIDQDPYSIAQQCAIHPLSLGSTDYC